MKDTHLKAGLIWLLIGLTVQCTTKTDALNTHPTSDSLDISLTKVYIHRYESDSLNKQHAGLPIISFYFKGINPS